MESSYLKKSSTFNKTKWLIRVTLTNTVEITFSLTIKELRTYILNNIDKHSHIGNGVDLVNKYVFPCVLDRFKDSTLKHIKIRSN